MFFVQWRGSPASAIGHPQTWILAKPVRIILIPPALATTN